ncbi:allantoate amidohydrolase [Neoasaia chiangmaiensis NBRC 101099]|uniref:Zn-dependent hydrolase n=1 Tax=Neoasaia chiangmaiensis TaxID=320497 RepID=A0A1U9KLW3_9PROT|nr:allantoate amidohydrolase [Neoasaia chiangmaiensis]AQS86787.1 Zn-dependent hydrolase [Neoasaia chiangmaiensis]GBR35449.1 allantoate amidohydrolase [Neoasaia chiangmaiensis NBRC 101099]GEN16353.1 Zn-dependent hydrolase [Neoasaia chiangmaiensis]
MLGHMETVFSRAKARCDLLGIAPYSDRSDMLFRPYLGAGHRATLETLTTWMREAGMTVSVDAAANIVGRYGATSREAPVLLFGSHVDSVENGGRYDGMLGVLLGIEVVEHFHRQGRRFPFALEVIGFGDEEGSRFPAYMLGSRAAAGMLGEADGDVRDIQGITLREALAEWGLSPEHLPTARRMHVAAYIEAHIEQAPHLERAGRSLGAVRGIASQYRYRATFEGQAAHAGTAMHERRDALAAAAEAILALERIGQDGPSDLVVTVGDIAVISGAPNVVPGRVGWSIDMRALDMAVLEHAANAARAELERIATERGMVFSLARTQDLRGALCDVALERRIRDAIRETTGEEPPELVSQAGHDAMIVADLAPMAMLFIRCAGGISHNPAEAVAEDDVEVARAALIRFVEKFEV